MQQYHDRSYERHAAHARDHATSVPSVLGNPGSIDAHRHERMYTFAKPLLSMYPDATWLTVGDTGADAQSLKNLGATNIICSSLSTAQIVEMRNLGHLDSFETREINAEAIDLADDSVDFVLCKESYHHFPRPAIAVYELLRVCRRGVVFIEPAEPTGWKPLDSLKTAIKSVLRRKAAIMHEFEASGNYLYRLSKRELTKQAVALQLGNVASLYFNDFFHARLSPKKMNDPVPRMLFELGVFVQNTLARLRLMNYGLIVYVLFKENLTTDQIEKLRSANFSVEELPRNPYFEID